MPSTTDSGNAFTDAAGSVWGDVSGGLRTLQYGSGEEQEQVITDYNSFVTESLTGQDLTDEQANAIVEYGATHSRVPGVDAVSATATAAGDVADATYDAVAGPPGKLERLLRGVGLENLILLVLGLVAFLAVSMGLEPFLSVLDEE